jgi:ATP-binding cassette subfamily B protein
MGNRKRLYLFSIFAFCAVEIAGSVLYSTGVRGAINSLSGNDHEVLFRSIFLIFLCAVIWWIYAPISSYCCSISSKGTVQRLKAELTDHIIRLPMSAHDRLSKGEMLSSLTNDIGCLQSIYDWFFFQIWRTSLGGIAGLILMAVIDWRFAIIVFALGCISVWITSLFNRCIEKNGEALQESLAKTTIDSYELIKGAKTLRLLHLQGYFTEKVNMSSQAEADIKYSNGKVTARMKSIISAVAALTYAVILLIGALFVHFGLTEWGTIIALLGLKIATDMLFVEFGEFMAGMQNGVAGIKRLFELMETPQEDAALSNIVIEQAISPLVMKNITFAYSGSTVLTDFSMRLSHSGLTVLAGESGSGKSTIMKLILGLYSPQSGRIIFDGAGECTLPAVRSKTAYVPQESLLFRGTVLENILLGNSAASRTDAENAAKLAGADIFIKEMEHGYDTVLSDDGNNLSGGQKQRIAIARALIKNAPILLLDEITSALDAETEEQIINTVKAISKTKSVLFITHKAAITAQADKVIQLSSTNNSVTTKA